MKPILYNWCKYLSDHNDHYNYSDDHCGHKCDGKYEDCASSFFSKLPIGTIVTVIGDSGTMYDMIEFKNFNPKTGCVTLIDEDVSPPEASTIIIDSEKIESVSFTTQP